MVTPLVERRKPDSRPSDQRPSYTGPPWAPREMIPFGTAAGKSGSPLTEEPGNKIDAVLSHGKNGSRPISDVRADFMVDSIAMVSAAKAMAAK